MSLRLESCPGRRAHFLGQPRHTRCIRETTTLLRRAMSRDGIAVEPGLLLPHPRPLPPLSMQKSRPPDPWLLMPMPSSPPLIACTPLLSPTSIIFPPKKTSTP